MQPNVATLVPAEAPIAHPPAVPGAYPGSYYEEPGLFDLASIRAILWRQRWILLLITSVIVLAGLVLTMLMTPVYTASATVRIDPNGSEIIEGQEVVDPYIASNELLRHMETLKSVIQSRSMALHVVDDLELYNNTSLLGEMASEGPRAGQSDEARRNELRMIAANILMGQVTVDIPLNTRIMQIGFSSPDAGLAAMIANSYADNFLSDNIERSVQANAYAREYLEREIAETREELRQGEMQAIEYARANRIIGQPSETALGSDIGTAQTLTVTNLADMAAQLNVARGERIDAEQRWRTVANLPAAQLPEVRENATIDSMRTRVTELNGTLSELRVRYRDDHPSIQGANAEIATLERQIASASAEVKRSIQNDFQIALRQEQALERELARVSGETLDEQDRRVQYNLIARDVAASRDQLEILLQRYNLVSSASNVQRNDATLLDNAVVPGVPSSPNLFTNLFLALVLGLGLAVAIAVLREVFDDRLRSIEDIEGKLRVPALGQTPFVGRELGDELDSVFSPISEAYASIRATLDFALPKSGHWVIQFTSSQPGEGKTTSAIALATKFAGLGRKVLLIDLDLRRPAVAKSLGRDRPALGVVDVLHGRVPLEKAVIDTGTENLSVLLSGKLAHNPVEILSSGLIPEFIAQHRRHFDVIVIDSSPVLGIADAPLLSRFVDAVVFVVEANRVHHGQVRQAVRRLREMNANIIGAMLTKFKALEAGKDYNYQYKYYAYNEN